ncbi:MAG TPA: PIG-L family deacetylase, partial [Eoetvoesiella sp.]
HASNYLLAQHTRADEEEKIGPPVLVVSPHYDDAIFSCAGLLAARPGSTVVTVYTGLPAQIELSTDWDRRCGFANALEAIRIRNTENQSALALVNARAIDLDFLDSQYVRGSSVIAGQLVDTLSCTILRQHPAAVFAPLGLFHEDHICTSNALMTLCRLFPAMPWFVYEEIPYRVYQGLVQERLSWLLIQGLTATPANLRCTVSRKAPAVASYRSQLAGLGAAGVRSILQEPECYWRLTSRKEQAA